MTPRERYHWSEAEHEVRAIPTPAVATGFTYTVPGTVLERVMSLSFVLVADANAANRICRVEYLAANGDVFASVAAPFTVTAAITSRLTFGVGLQQFGANAAAQIGGPLLPIKLRSGLSVRVAVLNVQVGDQISVAYLSVEQWPVRED